MRLFGGKDEHHETPCDTKGAWWAKPNPMGYGSNKPRTVKPAGKHTFEMARRGEMHETRGEWKLGQMAGEYMRRSSSPKPSQWSREKRRP